MEGGTRIQWNVIKLYFVVTRLKYHVSKQRAELSLARDFLIPQVGIFYLELVAKRRVLRHSMQEFIISVARDSSWK